MTRTFLGFAFALLSCLPIVARAAGPDEAAQGPTTRLADKATLEKKFAELLTDATLTGQFSGMDLDKPPHTDSYKIRKAVKGEGDNWAITAVMEFKGFPIPVTMTVPVLWAGDTPVISVTNMKFVAVGTYTARVMFYQDHYVGVWNGATHGGLMWGKVEHGQPATKPATKPGQ